jgi:hypothetical protein
MKLSRRKDAWSPLQTFSNPRSLYRLTFSGFGFEKSPIFRPSWESRANCKLDRSRNLIGLEVLTVDGQDLRPEKGMVRQILDAFDSKTAAPTVTLKFNSRDSNGEPIKVTFARQ